MQRLPLAARPPVPSHDASSCFSVAWGKAACCGGSLKQKRSGRAAHLAVAATAVTGRAAAPFLAAALLLAAAPSALPSSIPPAFAQPEGASLFRKACIGCHDMGGNILQPGATLFLKDLERNGVATEEELYNITYYGKGRMPANTSALLADEEDADVVAALDPLLTVTTTTTATTEGGGGSVANPDDDRIDELDVLDEDAAGADAAEDVPASAAAAAMSLVWDHAVGAARLPFRLPIAVDALPVGTPHLDAPRRIAAAVFGSDDELVDLDLRVEISSIGGVEDALLLKPASGGAETRLRAGWARWLEGKADYLRRDRMLRSNLETLNPRNHPLLQDPDSSGFTSLTRGDRMVQRMILAEIEKPANKNFERRRLLSLENQQGMGVTDKKEQGKGRRWGHFPGIDPHLGFSEFLERFFEHGKCSLKVFMVWNSPQWSYGVRHQRGLESLLQQHPDACVVKLSETLELEFFRDFVKEGYVLFTSFNL
ncbi:hypothetical protein PR202_gb21289 [Eleusine coracana subsp. coracana]|uniref:Cytochrome c domain-containing protein n=1 Tax=Eleusine coracana subsp. coracana TaxID=191504 RepID=A0AAV5FD91_ELECO|nr:hypothetical protein PR202_gb21289 [Eleusine coracana subsp. coracana]